MLRTHTCNELTLDHINTEVSLCGWVDTIRNLGGMIFIDLRDKYGITQIKIDPDQCHHDIQAFVSELTLESVINVKGRVIKRPDGMHNKAMNTGAIEIQPTMLTMLSKAQELPFVINFDHTINEDTRLTYRYLDLRRWQMKQNLTFRHKIVVEIINFFDQQGFEYIETPHFVKNTPEGSKEYLVSTRSHPWKFFVLPQSPQQLKQLCMVAWCDKYFQIAKCFRDEALRGDRQPEFTQLDLEMSFVEQEDIIKLVEHHLITMTKKLFPHKKIVSEPFERMSRHDAMNIYGSDKPELRTKEIQLIDLTQRWKQSSFNLFQKADYIKAICVPKLYNRSEIDKHFVVLAQQKGAWGLARLSYDGTERKWSILKFFDQQALEELKNLATPTSDQFTLFFQADQRQTCVEVLGFLRNYCIKDCGLLKGKDDEMAFARVVDFPLYEFDPTSGEFWSAHHPFTKPKNENIPTLLAMGQKILSGWSLSQEDKTILASLKADSYDIICNGYELGWGSIRITDPKLQTAIFAILWLTQSQITERFGHLIKAFNYGVPPHGGLAYGLDRLVMLYQNMPNIREVIAFPKNWQGEDLLMQSPSTVDLETLKEFGITTL